MAEYHMQKGNMFFLSGSAVLTCSILGLASVLIAWAVGGTEYKDSIFGDQAIAVFVAGIAIGAGLVTWSQGHGHQRTN